MSKLSKALASIYTDKNKVSVLEMINSLIKTIDEFNTLYEHNIFITNDSGAEVMLKVINTNNTSLTENDILEYCNTNGGVGVQCTGIDRNNNPIYGCYTEDEGLTLKTVSSDGPSESSFAIGNIIDIIKEVN